VVAPRLCVASATARNRPQSSRPNAFHPSIRSSVSARSAGASSGRSHRRWQRYDDQQVQQMASEQLLRDIAKTALSGPDARQHAGASVSACHGVVESSSGSVARSGSATTAVRARGVICHDRRTTHARWPAATLACRLPGVR
jgi:hypothetical protein